MKMKIRMILVFFVGFSTCFGEVKEELSHFLYHVPVMEGMEIQGRPEEVKNTISDNIEIAIITKVLHSKEGYNISSEEISKFYTDYFVSKGFRARQETSGFSGTFGAPSVSTSGNAHIWSQGRIKYWIPKDGNSITFFIYQRRDFNIRESQPLLDKITAAFETAASEFKYKFTVLPDYTTVSDWPVYLENECFVNRVLVEINYGEIEESRRTGFGDNKTYMIYFSVFPTPQHAQQWMDKLIEEHNKEQRWPDWYVSGLGMSPITIQNVVIEYRGKGNDKSNPDFRKKIMDELSKIHTVNSIADIKE